MNNIKYIGFHHCYEKKLKKNFSLAATNKMDYLAKVLSVDLNFKVNLISPSWYSINSEISDEIKNTYYTSIFFCNSLKFSNKIAMVLNIFYSSIWLFFYLIFNVKKNEKILIYHSPWLCAPIILARLFKTFKIILEVEEIYSAVWQISKFMKFVENKLFKISDSYIVVSETLGEMLPEKPKIILYGSYWMNSKKVSSKNINSDLEVVYSGAIDSYLGGAFNLVESALYLNKNIKINILGYGSDDEILKLQNLIIDTNLKAGFEIIKFHGLLHSDEFNTFLQNCDVGINPQNEGKYMDSAFPSKILTYFSNNLMVVSTNILGVKQSKVKDFIIFTKDDNVESIAEVLNNIDLSIKSSNLNIIQSLENDFILQFKKLLA
jgi:hypothetical protein